MRRPGAPPWPNKNAHFWPFSHPFAKAARRKEQEGGGDKKKVRFHPQRFRRPPGGDSHRIRAPPLRPRRSPPAAILSPQSRSRGPAGRPFCEASAGGQRLRGREGQPRPAPPFVPPKPSFSSSFHLFSSRVSLFPPETLRAELPA